MIKEANINDLRDFVAFELQYARELLKREKKEVVDIKKFMEICTKYCVGLLQSMEAKVYFYNQWEGFCVVYVSGARWFLDKVAYMDHFFLIPGKRIKGSAEEMAKEVESKLKEEKVKELYLLFTPTEIDRAGRKRALEFGFNAVGTYYRKDI